MSGVVIVGAGMAGAQLATTLRQKGFERAITLVGDESRLPYQRPPLSKGFVKGDGDEASVSIRPEAFYSERSITLRTGVAATAIDRAARAITLLDGTSLPYDHLVLATGARNRRLPGDAVALELRTLDHAVDVRRRLWPGCRLVVIGGGFVGLELASSGLALGVEVTVVEALDRLMARAASPELATYLMDKAVGAGVDIVLAARVAAIEEGAVMLEGGRRIGADVVVAGIGVVPNTDLARDAGLDVDDGIVVDSLLRTSDPAISAIGDCARHPCAITGRALRLESVQNATDHARAVAARLTGSAEPYGAVPWFWTEQHGIRVQIAGVADDGALSVVRGDPSGGAFSVCRFEADRLVAVESVNLVADHLGARRLLAGGLGSRVTPEQVADVTVPLNTLAAQLV